MARAEVRIRTWRAYTRCHGRSEGQACRHMHIAYLGKAGVEIEHMGGPSLSFPKAAPSLRRLTFLFLRAVQRGQVSMKEAKPRGICRVALWPPSPPRRG